MRYRQKFPRPHVRRDENGYIIIDGYTYLGRPRVPPMPNRIALQDRTTGLYKVLGNTAGAGALELMDINPQWSDVEKYGPNDGPYNENFRLYLDNGVLGSEYAAGYNSRTILTRRDFDTSVLLITINQIDGTIEYTPYDL